MLRFFKKLMHLNLEIKHVSGSRNKCADILSRYGRGKPVIEDVAINEPFISYRSLRTVDSGLEVRDPLVQKLAEEGESDEDYIHLVKFVSGETNVLGKNSEYIK